MRKTLTTAVALVALGTIAAAFAAVAAGGTHSSGQRVRIDVLGSGSNTTFLLSPMSHGRLQRDSGPVTFCCWRSWKVTRAGAKLEVTNPRLTLVGTHGTLKIRNQIEWVGLPDDWSVWNGTWKVVGGTGAYAGLTGHGRDAGVGGKLDSSPSNPLDLKIRFFGFLGAK